MHNKKIVDIEQIKQDLKLHKLTEVAKIHGIGITTLFKLRRQHGLIYYSFTYLTEKEKRDIRRRYKQGGIRQIDLAREYGVTQHTISRTIHNKKYVKKEWNKALNKGRPRINLDREELKQAMKTGMTQKAIAAQFGCCGETLRTNLRHHGLQPKKMPYHSRPKLPLEQRKEIVRKHLVDKMTMREIAVIYDVCEQTVYNYCRKKTL